MVQVVIMLVVIVEVVVMVQVVVIVRLCRLRLVFVVQVMVRLDHFTYFFQINYLHFRLG